MGSSGYGAGPGRGSGNSGPASTAPAAWDGTTGAGGALGSGPAGGAHLLSRAKLRRLVSRLRGCLDSLPSQQNRILVLRTGLGLKHGYSRREVARILHMTLKREGLLERRATVALANTAMHSRCGNPLPGVRTAVMRAVSAVLAITHQGIGGASQPVLTTRSAPTAQASAASQRGASRRSGAGSKPSHQPPPPASAAIAAPPGEGFNWLLIVLALVVVLGLVALWFTFGRVRAQPSGATVANRRLRDHGSTMTGALDPARLRRAAAALPTSIGLVALLGAASARVRNRRAAALGHPANHGVAAAATPVAEPEPASARQAEPARDRESQINAPAAGAEPAAGIEAFELASALADRGDTAGAEAAYRRADEQGHPSAASNLGVLLEQGGDLLGAESAYRRADDRGDANGAFNLGSILADRGDLVGAEAAFRRSAQRGDAGAMFILSVLMERRNDLFGAEAALRRADERGHPMAATRLGMLLESRGDVAGAESAYRRADERGDGVGTFKLGGLLEKRHDLTGAEAAYARAAAREGSHVGDLARAALTLLRSGR